MSNFDVPLLDELYEMAVIKPHVVQNFAQPGEVDKDVRDWCKNHEVGVVSALSIHPINTSYQTTPSHAPLTPPFKPPCPPQSHHPINPSFHPPLPPLVGLIPTLREYSKPRHAS